MSETREKHLIVEEAVGSFRHFRGDVEASIRDDGGLVIFDYGFRDKHPVFNGIVYAATKEGWLRVNITPNQGDSKAD